MEITTGIAENPALRASFCRLARQTWGLDFETWHARGFWGPDYEPWCAVEGGEVRANVSVNHIRGTLGGAARHYIQLGTVMTDPAGRGKGFCRALLERVTAEYADCDGFFLYANDSVLKLYPRFGFARAKETRFWLKVDHGKPRAQRVPMAAPEDWARFLSMLRARPERSALPLDAQGLYMFYLTGPMRDCVYYLEREDALAVATVEGQRLTVYAVFAPEPVDLWEVCRAFGPGIRLVELAFPPEVPLDAPRLPYREEDTTLFLRGEGIRADVARIGTIPELAHA